MNRFLPAILAAVVLASCADKAPKALILYYSQTGITETVAMELQKMTGADIERFDVAEKYDGDFNATIQRCLEERKNGFLPTLEAVSSDLSSYDVIYLGYPIWFGTYAPPVRALLDNVGFAGKTVVPFCTFGSGGLYSSIEDLKKAIPDAVVAEGYGVRAARLGAVSAELKRFLIENGHIEGEVEALPGYSECKAPTEEEVAIYREATDGYPFPMGEPVAVGSRAVEGGHDYIFIVESTNPAGESVEGKVYIVKREGCKAEFTQAVR